MKEALLHISDVAAFSVARNTAHLAVQHLARAARANLPAMDDDSHSNLGWDEGRERFFSHDLGAAHIGLSLAPLALVVIEKNRGETSFVLDGASGAEAAKWLDGQLQRLGLKAAAAIALPYALPPEVAGRDTYPADTETVAFRQLAGWYGLAHKVLSALAQAQSDLQPGPSPVRCWPHHFDIATYIGLEGGDPETARGIGVGLSPGDEGYNEPYFYINPWPHLSAENLPNAPPPGHWHTEGYVGLIATASGLSDADDMASITKDFVENAFDLAVRERLKPQ